MGAVTERRASAGLAVFPGGDSPVGVLRRIARTGIPFGKREPEADRLSGRRARNAVALNRIFELTASPDGGQKSVDMLRDDLHVMADAFGIGPAELRELVKDVCREKAADGRCAMRVALLLVALDIRPPEVLGKAAPAPP